MFWQAAFDVMDFSRMFTPFILLAGLALIAYRSKNFGAWLALSGGLLYVAGHLAVLSGPPDVMGLPVARPVPGSSAWLVFLTCHARPIALLLVSVGLLWVGARRGRT